MGLSRASKNLLLKGKKAKKGRAAVGARIEKLRKTVAGPQKKKKY